MGLNVMCGGGQKVLINDELGEAQEYDIWKSMPIQAGLSNSRIFSQTYMMNGKAYYFPMHSSMVIEFDGEKSVKKNWYIYSNQNNNSITILGNDIYYIENNEIKKYTPGTGSVTYAACPASESYISQIIAFNGKIYAFCMTRPSDERYFTIQYFDESESDWVRVVSEYDSGYGHHYRPGYSSLVVFDDKIHILGGGTSSDNYNKHYSFDGTELLGDVTAPFSIAHGQAAVYDGKIHLIGAYEGPNKEYTFDGTTWATETVFSVNGENSYNDFAQTACLAKIAGKEFIIGLGQRFNIEKKPDLFICSYYNP